ncbi:MAG: Glycosyltransferase involved in cell wall biogenesis [Parcubacteria group bacterium GW2011_GWC2_42_6]|nr:MAG: Glycosyltransferase involved in cell wall biogenesis [Parcubacteria group bacterium GW2011_GWA2_42_11]KKS66916.1 MAG: Glycosyltransferase involved in cell wall biogenesis [Parcubacteria group bacterium GW2011_GWC2_42_6]
MQKNNNSNLKISCIIPAHDRNNLLLEAIGSVLSQSCQPEEIIIVNNGSAAVSLPDEIVSRVRVFDILPHAGVAQARNFGASVAQGDFLAFLDDDDLWNTDYLKNVSEAINDGAVCAISRLDKLKNKEISGFKNADNKITIKNILIFNPGLTGSNIVVAKNIFFAVGGFDPKLPPSEDKALILEILRADKKIVTLPDNQAIIRVHNMGRLTDGDKMISGIRQFMIKYKHLMNQQEYLFNLLKIYRYRRQQGEKKIILLQFLVKLLYLFKKLF